MSGAVNYDSREKDIKLSVRAHDKCLVFLSMYISFPWATLCSYILVVHVVVKGRKPRCVFSGFVLQHWHLFIVTVTLETSFAFHHSSEVNEAQSVSWSQLWEGQGSRYENTWEWIFPKGLRKWSWRDSVCGVDTLISVLLPTVTQSKLMSKEHLGTQSWLVCQFLWPCDGNELPIVTESSFHSAVICLSCVLVWRTNLISILSLKT